MSRVLFRQPGLFAHLGRQNGAAHQQRAIIQEHISGSKGVYEGRCRWEAKHNTHFSFTVHTYCLSVDDTCAHTHKMSFFATAGSNNRCTSQGFTFSHLVSKPVIPRIISFLPSRGFLHQLQHSSWPFVCFGKQSWRITSISRQRIRVWTSWQRQSDGRWHTG